jgi:hypothetical protein
LLSVIKHYDYQGIPIHMVKSIVRQVCIVSCPHSTWKTQSLHASCT